MDFLDARVRPEGRELPQEIVPTEKKLQMTLGWPGRAGENVALLPKVLDDQIADRRSR